MWCENVKFVPRIYEYKFYAMCGLSGGPVSKATHRNRLWTSICRSRFLSLAFFARALFLLLILLWIIL